MYITPDDVESRLGNDDYAVLVGSDDNASLRVIEAIQDAEGEIDGYVAQNARYTAPLNPVPNVIKRIAVDIGIYRLSGDSRCTEDRRKRYEDAVNFLKQLAADKVSLGHSDVDINSDDDASNDIVEITSQSRKFHRGNTNF